MIPELDIESDRLTLTTNKRLGLPSPPSVSTLSRFSMRGRGQEGAADMGSNPNFEAILCNGSRVRSGDRLNI